MSDDLKNSWKITEEKPEEKQQDSKPDMVNHPPHYTKGGIETIDVIKAKLGVNYKYYVKGNLMKYSDRLGEKDPWPQELRKIAWYALDCADFIEQQGNEN